MADWNGWAKQVLTHLGYPVSQHNLLFLHEWQTAEHTDCHFNPLSVTVNLAASVRCKELSHGLYARAYRTKAQGLKATVEQFKEKRYPQIRAALESGDPFTVSPLLIGFTDWQEVVGELGTWGAHTFANQYADAMKAGDGGGGGGRLPAVGIAGYNTFSRSLAHTLPTALRRTRLVRKQALRLLGAPRNFGG